MKTATTHCFTGTGNSAWVAQLVGKGLSGLRYSTREQVVSLAAPVEPAAGELQVFVFPVHAFCVPEVMRRYLAGLGKSQGQPAVVLAVVGEVNADRTLAGYEGRALSQALAILRRRGYDVVLADIVSHVVNFTQCSSPPKESEEAGIAALAQTQIDGIVAKLASGERSIRKRALFNRAWSFGVGWSYALVGRRMLGKLFVSDKRCDGCRLCATSCPVGAIGMVHGQPHWRWSCQGCQRCINICPRKAIQTSFARLIAMIGLFFVPYCGLLRPLLPGAWLNWGGGWGQAGLNAMLWMAGYFAAFAVADVLLCVLERVPLLRVALTWGHTRGFRRYIEPHFRVGR